MTRQLELGREVGPFVGMDVFDVARWLDDQWNSSASAVAADRVEWKCRTWGSGRGGGSWWDVATFRLIAEVFELTTWRDREGRDEAVVEVPMSLFPQVAALLTRLGDDPEEWPWLREQEWEAQVAVAARVLGMTESELVEDEGDLLEVLRLV